MKANCILFDLDGTLLNTNNLVMESLKHTIFTHLGKDVDDCLLYKYFGQPLVQIMEDIDPKQSQQMVLTYREYSAKKHDVLTHVFPQVPETLQILKEKGIPVGVVTSKLKSLAERGLSLFNLQGYIKTLVAYEDTDKHKPEPEPILRALEIMGIDPDYRVVMVGDSPYDLLCANNAGVRSAVVEWSLHPKDTLRGHCPSIWLTEFSALLNYL